MWAWLDHLILILLAIVVLIIFGGSIYAFLYAIFLFVFSAGDAEKIKQAWNSIRYMILGIVMTIFLLFIFPVIFKRVGLSSADKFTAQSIFNMSIQLVEYVFTFWKESIKTYQEWWSIGLPWWPAFQTWTPSTSPTDLSPPEQWWGFEL